MMNAVEQEQTPSTSSASGSPQLKKRHVLRPGDVRNVGATVQEATFAKTSKVYCATGKPAISVL